MALSLVFVSLVYLGRNLGLDTPILFTWTDGLILEFLFGVYLGLALEAGWRLPAAAAVIVVSLGTALAVLELQGPTFMIQGMPAALVVGGLVLAPTMHDTRATSWLSRIGDASYSLYLSHTFVLRPLRSVWSAVAGDELPSAVFVIVAIVAAVAASLFLYHLVERPMTTYLQRRLLTQTKPAATTAPRGAVA